MGEGGNLGFTQLGRIEYAMSGGLINTDALDNAAGVNTSDHEVNIKILLGEVKQKGEITESQRIDLLEAMEEDVAGFVLQDNKAQVQAVTMKQIKGASGADTMLRLQQRLTLTGQLDAKLEYLPDVEEVEERCRTGKGYTRPEISVLMSYAKAEINRKLLETKLPDDPALDSLLLGYFPNKMQKFAKYMLTHAVRREIIATVVTNDLVNNMGLTFLNRMRDETGKDTASVAAAYIVTKDLFDIEQWWQRIDGLTGKISPDLQAKVYDVVKRSVEFGVFWLLRNAKQLPNIERTTNHYKPLFADVHKYLVQSMSVDKKECYKRRAKQWQEEGLDEETANQLALLSASAPVPDLAELVNKIDKSAKQVMETYFEMGDYLQVSKLYKCISEIPVVDNWERVASLALLDQLFASLRSVTSSVFKKSNVEEWQKSHKEAAGQYNMLTVEMLEHVKPSHAMASVVLNHLRSLV